MNEEKPQFSRRECPCRYCNEHRAGCHTRACPHGWWEWNAYIIARREAISKRRRERLAWWYYRKDAMQNLKNRKKSKRGSEQK